MKGSFWLLWSFSSRSLTQILRTQKKAKATLDADLRRKSMIENQPLSFIVLVFNRRLSDLISVQLKGSSVFSPFLNINQPILKRF
jgi:hypothetical protein